MKFQTEVKQVLGTPAQGAWSQIHHFAPKEKEKFLKRGELILLVSLGKISQEQPTASVGREVISRFHEEYYGSLKEKPMTALEKSARRVAEEKSKYFDQPEEVSLVGLVLWEDIAYLVIYHQGKILLRREGKMVDLLNSQNGELVSASGRVKTNDIFILGTTDFFEKLPKTMVPAGLSTEDLDRMVEIWGPVVHAREDRGQLGAAMIKIGPQEEQPKFAQPPKKSTVKKSSTKPFWKKFKFEFSWPKKILKKISTLSVAFGFLILLAVSVFFGWKKRRHQQQEEKVLGLSEQIEEKISNANSIKNLDPEESLKLIAQAKELTEKLEKLDQGKADSFQARLDETKENLGEETLAPEPYYNLNLVGEDIGVQSVYSDGQEAYIFDSQGKRLVQVDLSGKSFQIITGGEELSGQGLLVSSKDRVYFIKNKKVYWLKNENIEELLDLGEDFNFIAADGWLGSLYLLDDKQEEIWKFPAISGGIGKERSWLNTKSGLVFGELVDMAIDSNIWLLSRNGQVYKYLSGDKQELEMDLPSGIGQAKYLAVAQEAERISFWDSENKIIWLFSKQGSFIARQPIEVSEIRGIAISPDGKKVYLFNIDKIYLVEL